MLMYVQTWSTIQLGDGDGGGVVWFTQTAIAVTQSVSVINYKLQRRQNNDMTAVDFNRQILGMYGISLDYFT